MFLIEIFCGIFLFAEDVVEEKNLTVEEVRRPLVFTLMSTSPGIFPLRAFKPFFD